MEIFQYSTRWFSSWLAKLTHIIWWMFGFMGNISRSNIHGVYKPRKPHHVWGHHLVISQLKELISPLSNHDFITQKACTPTRQGSTPALLDLGILQNYMCVLYFLYLYI
jgi:hypothetical protein